MYLRSFPLIYHQNYRGNSLHTLHCPPSSNNACKSLIL
jgi:hypothetical protein